MKLIDILQESPIKGGQQEVSEYGGTLKGFFKGVVYLTIKDLAKTNKTLAADLRKVYNAKSISGVTRKGGSVSDLVVVLAKGNLKGRALGDVAMGFMKTRGVSKNYIARLAPEVVSHKDFIKRYVTEGKKLTRPNLKNSGYTEDAIEEIIKAAKGSDKFQKALNKSKKVVQNAGTGTKSTTQGLRQAAKSFGAKVTGWFGKNKKPIKIAGSAGTKIKDKLKTAIKTKVIGIPILKLLLIGGVGYIGYKWWTRIEGELPDFPSDDDIDATRSWMECIVNALEGDDKAHDIVIGETKNSIQYDIANFGGEETGGHIVFYDDYTVKSKNGKTGKWSCSTTKNLKEQSEGEVTSQMINTAITQLDDQLSGDFFEGDASDMKDAYKILKSLEGTTYKGKDSLQVIKNNYPKVTGKKLSSHIGELTNLDFTAIEYRDEMLKMIGSSPKKKGGGAQGDSDDKGGSKDNDNLNHLSIIWDKSKGGGGSKGSKYKQCDNFPLNLYCITDKIKEVQKCLNPTSNLKVDGYYGPKTLKALRDNSIFADDKKDDTVITKSIYDKLMDNCNKSKDAVKNADGEVKRPKVEPFVKLETKPVELIKLDPIKMIDTHGVNKLMNQAKKRIDGERIQSIIDSKLKFRGGKYILKLDNELTDDQLKHINTYMSAKRFTLDKKKETLKDQKYVWKAIDRDARRVERKTRDIEKIKSKNDEK